jgi:predicted nucleic acid-binding protein
MKGVLVDTSVWIDHFRHSNTELAQLLALDLVLIHPLVLGEIACGTPPQRAQTLHDLALLQSTQQASMPETMALIDNETLFGSGCGWIDMQLLASTLISPGVELWTFDKRLDALAQRFAVAHAPRWH